MVTFKDKQFLINGKPEMIVCGEIHYYRLKKKDWQKVIDDLKEAGMNTVATYIPWVCHEFEHGKIDLTGEIREEHDIKGFLDLCTENGLYIIVRPGPFIMAEMKNEGIPFWVYKENPDAIPVTWDNGEATTFTLDYLNPGFLSAVKDWYEKIIGLISNYTLTNGGKVIAVQLDNEIGMLSWVSNCPVLTDLTVKLLSEWIVNEYGIEAAKQRYGFDVSDVSLCTTAFRSPKEEFVLEYHKDLGYFMRKRFRMYVDTLKGYAKEFGIKDIPYLINIHGSGGSRGTGYPIGISQLIDTYKDCDDVMSGIDFYIGDITVANIADIYLANIFTDAVNSKDQPLSALEFEAGDGNYGFNFDMRYPPHATDLKSRVFVAQGNRILNYYLFSGGENYRFDKKLNDGNDRIAITGQKHGFAAPIDHNQQRTSSYDMTKKVATLLSTNGSSLADMTEEYDNIAFSFIPDYYMTEYRYPKSEKEKAMVADIRRVQDGGLWNILAKSLLLTNHSFFGLDVQNKDILSEIGADTVLIFTVCRYMAKEVQENAIKFMKAGGSAIIYGELPIYDMEGNDCTILCDYLGVKVKDQYSYENHHYTSVYPCGMLEGYPEIPMYNGIQTVEAGSDCEVFMRIYENDDICGFIKQDGKATIACFTSIYHSNLEAMLKIFERVGIKRKLSHDFMYLHGIFMTSCKNKDDERFLHVINLDYFDKEAEIVMNGEKLFERKFKLGIGECVMVPLNVKPFKENGCGMKVVKSTAEIYQKNFAERKLTFRLTQDFDEIIIETKNKVVLPECMAKYSKVEVSGNVYKICVESYHLLDKFVTLEV